MMAKRRTRVFRSDRLRALTEEFQGSQEDFAARIGIDQSQLNRYINGKSEPTPDLIRRIAQSFDVRTDWLLGLTADRDAETPYDSLSPLEKAVIRALRDHNGAEAGA